MKETELRSYWRFFVEAWKLFRRHRDVKSEQEWEQTIEEAKQLRDKFPGEFSQNVLSEILKELETLGNSDRGGFGSTGKE